MTCPPEHEGQTTTAGFNLKLMGTAWETLSTVPKITISPAHNSLLRPLYGGLSQTSNFETIPSGQPQSSFSVQASITLNLTVMIVCGIPITMPYTSTHIPSPPAPEAPVSKWMQSGARALPPLLGLCRGLYGHIGSRGLGLVMSTPMAYNSRFYHYHEPSRKAES